RYRDAQVTPEFEIRLFTGEKSDFLQAHELSGGTLQGLSFGFRLAFAQAFVRAVTEAPQFLFLDEPFPAMDRMRVLRTLQALPRLSQELSQVFVAHPDLDSDARDSFDLLIETEVGVDHLDMDLASFGISKVPEPMPDPPLPKRRAPAPPPSPAVETSSTDRPIFGSEEAPAREVVKPNPAASEPPQEPAPPPPPPVAPPEPPATELPLDSDDWTIPGA
ncbi:MAG: hypothetical protein HRU16_07730, partial [Planctomycetes bacterium]|nr:hypothetical protein [Planctomycetota bacterium]